jgi:hypothetical protein
MTASSLSGRKIARVRMRCWVRLEEGTDAPVDIKGRHSFGTLWIGARCIRDCPWASSPLFPQLRPEYSTVRAHTARHDALTSSPLSLSFIFHR